MNDVDLMKYWFESANRDYEFTKKQVENIKEVQKWLKEQ